MHRLCVAALLGVCGSASAQIYLTSVNAWQAHPDTGANVGGPWEFDNVPGSANAELIVNSAPRGTTFELSMGDNLFAFQTWSGVPNNHAVGLWFGSTSAHFAGPNGAVPHLVAFTNSAQALATPGAGVMVGTWGPMSPDGPYHGMDVHQVGTWTVRVTDYAFDGSSGVGSFVLHVVPAPGSAMVLLGAAAMFRRRR